MTRIAVTGGRNYGFIPPHTPNFVREGAQIVADRERQRFTQIMDATIPRLGITELAAGRCRTGADELAERWAKANKIPFTGFPANWQRLGNSAGPERNGRMLREFRPEKVIAFQGGDGTLDCCRQAWALGIEIITIDWTFTP